MRKQEDGDGQSIYIRFLLAVAKREPSLGSIWFPFLAASAVRPWTNKTNESFKRFKVGRESDVTSPSLSLPLPSVFILRHFFPSLFFFYILFLHGSRSMLQGKDEFISPLIPFFFSSLTVRFFYNSTPIYIFSVR
ncbi:MAG: hypothetical protein BYD32DRAFT_207771 [Podila humilis]|nr:MAG: hypothetical protein BYD32DRAFT_207771 [Podila humilis]